LNFQVERDGKIYAPCPGCGQRVELKELPDGEAICGGCKSTFPYRVPPGVGPQPINQNSPCQTEDVSDKETPRRGVRPHVPAKAQKKKRSAWTKEDGRLLLEALNRGGMKEAKKIFGDRFSVSKIYTEVHALKIDLKDGRKTWSGKDLAALRELYPAGGSILVSKAINGRHSADSIRRIAHDLGLHFQEIIPWTDEEDRILRQAYPEGGIRAAYIALDKRHPKGSIKSRVHRFKIKREKSRQVLTASNSKSDFSIKVKPGQKVTFHIEIVPEAT